MADGKKAAQPMLIGGSSASSTLSFSSGAMISASPSTTCLPAWLNTRVAMRTRFFGSFEDFQFDLQVVAELDRTGEAQGLAEIDGAWAGSTVAIAALIRAPLSMPWAMRSLNWVVAA